MSFFSKKKAVMQYRLIVDLEPNSVGVGLTHLESSKLEFFDRQYLAYTKRPTSKQMSTKIATLLNEILRKSIMPNISGGKIVSALCMHSSAWSVAETHIVDLHFPKPTRINEKMVVDNIRNHRNDHVANAQTSHELELVYHHIQKVRLNGYPTNAPWDKMAENISCDIVEGYIDRTLKKVSEDALFRLTQSIVHVPSAFVAISAARTVVENMPNSLIVHMGGETTEIIYGDAHQIYRSASVPSGVSSLTRAISEYVHNDNALAFSHISLAVKGSRIATKKEQIAFNNALEAWKKLFMEGIHVVCGTHVPEKILFSSATHDIEITEHMLDSLQLGKWSGKQHELINLFGKKSFQHDFMIAAGALYVIE